MKKISFQLLMLFVVSHATAQTLSGNVFDRETKETLPGASVYVPDLKSGAVTDANGHYEIKNLPRRKFVVTVKSIGYTTVSMTIDLSTTTKKDFPLALAAIESPEVVVTGSAFSSVKSQSSVPVEQLSKINITAVGTDNLVNAIATTPGVSVISTGESVSKPVIRGLGFNRIVTVNEGVRQEGQQWGDEHGIEIDEFSADRIEVLKGPSSLLYGSDALGGVINILEPVSPASGKIQGEIFSKYATNNQLTANSLMLEGNQSGFVWRGRGTYKSSASYNTPTERIYNSGMEEKNAEVLAGLNRSWGYSHLHGSLWDSDIGFFSGDRDSISGKLLKQNGEVPTQSELDSRDIAYPYQHVSHRKVSWVNNLIVGQSQLRINAGWQENDRREFPDEQQTGLWLHLSTLTYDLKYYFPQRDSMKGVEAVIGAGGMQQRNENKGSEFLIPDYTMNDAGIFVSVKKTFHKATVNAGVRYDYRKIDGASMRVDSSELFHAFNNTYSSFSGSVGTTYSFNDQWSFKANVGSGFRAPNISELSSNGVHEGTFRYEIGNPDLKPEHSLQLDAGLSADGKKIGFSFDVFYNYIENFIYYRRAPEIDISLNDENLPVYSYTQGNSTLKGLELSLDIHPVSNLHFENSVAYVEGVNEDLHQPLPYIPPMKFESELEYTFKIKKSSRISEPYIKASSESCLAQNKIADSETSTPGYSIFNASAGTHFRLGKQRLLVFIAANNVFDRSYYNHLSRLKEKGIYEMGRNVTFGLHVPFGLR